MPAIAAALPWITAAVAAVGTGAQIHQNDVQGQESRHAADVQQQAQDAALKQQKQQAADQQATATADRVRDSQLATQKAAAGALSGQAGTILTGLGTQVPNSVLGSVLGGSGAGSATGPSGNKTLLGA